MLYRDFFRLLIKLFALQALIGSFFVLLPSAVSYLDLWGEDWLFYSLSILGSAIVIILLFIWIIFNPDRIVNALKLDSGFEEERFALTQITTQSILQLGVIIIGGLLFVENVIPFITDCYYALKLSQQYLFDFGQNGHAMVVSGVNSFLGYLLFSNGKRIASWFLKAERSDEPLSKAE